jgi:N-methylhydantoinase A
MNLSIDAAEAAIRARIAEPMGIGVVEAAFGIHQVVNENMIAATRIHVAERGADVRRMYLMGFGGAGPVHADAIARALKMRGYVIPQSAGVTSALGFLTAPMSFELARGLVGAVTQERLAELDAVYAALEEEGRALLRGAGLEDGEMTFTRLADLRHAGQGHEIVLELPYLRVADVDLDADVRPLFYETYEAVYGHAHRHLGLEIVTCRLTASGPPPSISLQQEESVGSDAGAAVTGSRAAYFAELGGFHETPTYDRGRLHAGATFAGPAIVEEKDSTLVIGPGTTAFVDHVLNLVVTFD